MFMGQEKIESVPNMNAKTNSPRFLWTFPSPEASLTSPIEPIWLLSGQNLVIEGHSLAFHRGLVGSFRFHELDMTWQRTEMSNQPTTYSAVSVQYPYTNFASCGSWSGWTGGVAQTFQLALRKQYERYVRIRLDNL